MVVFFFIKLFLKQT